MNLALPTTSHPPLPKYHRVYLVLRELLADGRFAGGMPGELQLVKQFGVARVTIRRALAPGWFISAPASHMVSRSLALTRAARSLHASRAAVTSWCIRLSDRCARICRCGSGTSPCLTWRLCQRPGQTFCRCACRVSFALATLVYINPTDDLIGSVQALQQAGVGLSCVSQEIVATRRVAALLDAGNLQGPVYLPFHWTSGGVLAGDPVTKEGIDANLAFLPKGQAIEWAALNLQTSILPLAEQIISEAGHVQIGLGDYHYAELGAPGNSELVSRVVDVAKRPGRDIASLQEAREMRGLAAQPAA